MDTYFGHQFYLSDQSAMLDLSISKNLVKLLWAKEDSYKLTGFLKFVSNLEMRQLWILPASAIHHSHVLLPLSKFVKLWIPLRKHSDVSKQESIWSLLHPMYMIAAWLTRSLPEKETKRTLYNVILRIAWNFLETRENIKISTYPFYHINLDWF